MTGEQGYVYDERSCFWTWDDAEGVWQSRQYKSRQLKRRKGKRNGNHKGISKRAEEHSLAKNKHKILKCGQKRTLLGGTKDAKARKDCQKAMMAFRRVVFALTSQIKAQSRVTIFDKMITVLTRYRPNVLELI